MQLLLRFQQLHEFRIGTEVSGAKDSSTRDLVSIKHEHHRAGTMVCVDQGHREAFELMGRVLVERMDDSGRHITIRVVSHDLWQDHRRLLTTVHLLTPSSVELSTVIRVSVCQKVILPSVAFSESIDHEADELIIFLPKPIDSNQVSDNDFGARLGKTLPSGGVGCGETSVLARDRLTVVHTLWGHRHRGSARRDARLHRRRLRLIHELYVVLVVVDLFQSSLNFSEIGEFSLIPVLEIFCCRSEEVFFFSISKTYFKKPDLVFIDNVVQFRNVFEKEGWGLK